MLGVLKYRVSVWSIFTVVMLYETRGPFWTSSDGGSQISNRDVEDITTVYGFSGGPDGATNKSKDKLNYN